MKKYLFLIIFSLILSSCVSSQVKQRTLKNLEIVKNSYLEDYSETIKIDKLLRRVSDGYYKWNYSFSSYSKNKYECTIKMQYEDLYDYQMKYVMLCIYFKYDEQTGKVSVYKIWEPYLNKWYTGSNGIFRAMNGLYYLYSKK